MDSQFMDPWIMIIPQNPKYPVYIYVYIYILLKCITTNVFNRLSLQQQPLSTVIFVAKITAFAAAVKNERRELHRLGPCLVNMAAGESEKKTSSWALPEGFCWIFIPKKYGKTRKNHPSRVTIGLDPLRFLMRFVDAVSWTWQWWQF